MKFFKAKYYYQTKAADKKGRYWVKSLIGHWLIDVAR